MTTAIEAAAGPRLWWGNYRARYVCGLALIVLGVAATNLTSTYSIWFLAIGPAVQAIGWLLMPGALWRRAVVLLPCLLAGLTLLAGADFAGAFAVLLVGWLLVRHRPAISYLALLPPIIASFIFKELLHAYDQNWIVLTLGTATVIGSAWLAVWIERKWAAFRRIPSQPDRTLR